MALQDFRIAGPDPSLLLPDARDAEEILHRDAIIARIRLFIESFPFDAVKLGPLDIGDDSFMEILIITSGMPLLVINHLSQKNRRKRSIMLIKSCGCLKVFSCRTKMKSLSWSPFLIIVRTLK